MLAFAAVVWAIWPIVVQFAVGVLGFVVMSHAGLSGDYVSAMLGALVYLKVQDSLSALACK